MKQIHIVRPDFESLSKPDPHEVGDGGRREVLVGDGRWRETGDVVQVA